ncbi:hypothetical protein [Desulfohalovibrio reitneri]|uniref:hypothetical protein n=1 Tax=Desulfohalovibrio reitneri TaxID=1307759 RepID=UPI000A3E34B3|nr:hypothetical protein [Desulfohalovibrio reitneri]
MVLFGNKKRPQEGGDEGKFEHARQSYFSGKLKIVTTERIEGRKIKWTFGLVASRSFSSETAFYGLVHNALEAGADAVVGYRENVAFHPDGDRHYTCYGTAVFLEPLKKPGMPLEQAMGGEAPQDAGQDQSGSGKGKKKRGRIV